MAIPAQHPEPADAAARRAVEPMTVYTVDKLPVYDRTFYETVRSGMILVDELTVPPRDARAFEVPAGHLFRIVSIEGPQVGDLNLWNADDLSERFYSGKTRALHATHVGTGDRLWSNFPRLRPMATDRGNPGTGARFQVCGPFAALPSVATLRPLGVDLHRSTLAGWMGKASFHLMPVVERLAWHLKRSGRLFMDEARAPVLGPGRGKTKTGYLWALARDERPWAGLDPPGWCSSTRPAAADATPKVYSKDSKGSCVSTGMSATTWWRFSARGWSVVFAGLTPGASCARFGTATARRSPPKGCGASWRCTPSRRRSGVNLPPRFGLAVRQARIAPLAEDFGVWLRRQRARVSPSRAWARSWPISATIGTARGCSSPTAGWRWTTTS